MKSGCSRVKDGIISGKNPASKHLGLFMPSQEGDLQYVAVATSKIPSHLRESAHYVKVQEHFFLCTFFKRSAFLYKEHSFYSNAQFSIYRAYAGEILTHAAKKTLTSNKVVLTVEKSQTTSTLTDEMRVGLLATHDTLSKGGYERSLQLPMLELEYYAKMQYLSKKLASGEALSSREENMLTQLQTFNFRSSSSVTLLEALIKKLS